MRAVSGIIFKKLAKDVRKTNNSGAQLCKALVLSADRRWFFLIVAKAPTKLLPFAKHLPQHFSDGRHNGSFAKFTNHRNYLLHGYLPCT